MKLNNYLVSFSFFLLLSLLLSRENKGCRKLEFTALCIESSFIESSLGHRFMSRLKIEGCTLCLNDCNIMCRGIFNAINVE